MIDELFSTGNLFEIGRKPLIYESDIHVKRNRQSISVLLIPVSIVQNQENTHHSLTNTALK